MENISQKVAEVNQYHKPFVELDYFKWLKLMNKKDIHGIETKVEYLEKGFGFVRGVDNIDKRTLDILKYTERFFFDFYILKRGITYA